MKVCIITDNVYIHEKFTELIQKKRIHDVIFEFYYTSWNHEFYEKYGEDGVMRPIILKNQDESFFSQYDLFISLHCKQLFPEQMVTNHCCINVHPGFNPYNRGWYPQVFGIINGLPIGVTIHTIDKELDHGAIIYQKQLKLQSYETSKDIYQRILATEIELLDEHFQDLLTGNYVETPMDNEGNINYKKDFFDLCELDLDKPTTYREVINHLRALSFAPYNNAYFIDEDGNKIYVGITLNKENKQ